MKENSREDRINNAYCFLNSMHSDFRTGLYYKEDLENLEHILSDYKRVLKENEELKNDYENLSNSVVVKNHCIKNSIPVQKVKDKISERQFELQQEYKDFEDDAILIVLQELLEGRK